jgi:hypothetical protein
MIRPSGAASVALVKAMEASAAGVSLFKGNNPG